MSSTLLVEARAKHAAKQTEMKAFLDSAKVGNELNAEKIKGLNLTNASFAEKVRAMDAELNDLFDEAKAIADVEEIGKRREIAAGSKANQIVHDEPGQKNDDKGETPSIGKAFVESDAYKLGLSVGKGSVGPASDLRDQGLGVKTLMSTSAGWAPQAVRTGVVIPDEQRPPEIVDVMNVIPTNQNAYVYMEETTFTNNADFVTEGISTTWGEAALVFTERSITIRRIGVYLPVTDVQLEDIEGIEAYLNQRLPFMVRQQMDADIIAGTGTAPEYAGLSNATGLQTVAKAGGETRFDTAHRALTAIRVTGRANPSHYLLHPNDWEAYRLTRTADGIYILGNPADTAPMRLWGLPVVASTALTENTGYAGDFRTYAYLVEKRGMDVQVGWYNTQFLDGSKSIRADVRVAPVFQRGTAFCSMTGI